MTSLRRLKMSNNDKFVSSRFLLWEKPIAYPFFDVITRDTNPGKVFDLNIDLDSYDGSVYLKPEHVVEMARTLGMMTVEEANKLREENAELRRQVNKLPVAQEELKNGLDDLTARFFASLNTVDNSIDNGSDGPAQDDRKSEDSESDSEQSFSF